jgi:hypothetical protein
MKVYILCYRGTIYGIFDSREKACFANRLNHESKIDVIEREVL